MLLNLQPQVRRYDKYGLKENPFPYVGVPNESIPVYTDRRKELELIQDAILGALRGSSSHTILLGTYGNGKTATLRLIKSQFDQQLEDAVAIYLSNPGESFLDFYRNLIYEYGLDNLETLVWRFLEVTTGEENLKERTDIGEVLISDILDIGKKRIFRELKYTAR